MSNNDLSDEVAEELRLLAHKFAEDIRDEADSAANERRSGSTNVTKRDVRSAWLQFGTPAKPLYIRTIRVLQFIVMTVTLAAVVFLVFQLTAKTFSPLESAALVVVTLGFFYTLVNVGISIRRLFSTPEDTASSRALLQSGRETHSTTIDIKEGEYLATESESAPSSPTFAFVKEILQDEKMTSRVGFLIRQLSLGAVAIVAAIAGFIYLGIHEFASELQYIIAFGSALLYTSTRLVLRSIRQLGKAPKKASRAKLVGRKH